MSDKKKKKLKQKQKQRQQQSQQVVINIGGRRRAERKNEVREKNKLNTPLQPVPIVQYVYRDNLALNAINEKMRENAITQSLLKTAQQLASQTQTPQVPKLATPSPALHQQSSTTQTSPKPTHSKTTPFSLNPFITSSTVSLQSPSPSVTSTVFGFQSPPTSTVQNLLQRNQLFNQTTIPTEKSNKNNSSEFNKVTKVTSTVLDDDDEEEDNNVSRKGPITTDAYDDYLRKTMKLTKHLVPRKNAKNYNEVMETYIANLHPALRNAKQQKAYEEYLKSLQKPSADDNNDDEINKSLPTSPPPPTNPLVRTYGIQSSLGRSMQTALNNSTLQSVKSNLDFQQEDDED